MSKKLIKNFYDWCIENNRYDLIERWDNKCSPKEVGFTSSKVFAFKCPKNLHKSELHKISYITHDNILLKCNRCNSFETWCIDNNRQDILDRWDYDKNAFPPSEISYAPKKKYYLKCENRIHESKLCSIDSLTAGNRKNFNCIICGSLAQWGINNMGEDFLEKYWDYEKNKNVDPWAILKGSYKKVWIYCQNKIHGSYLISCNHFTSGRRCPFCSGKKAYYLESLGYLFPNVIEIWSTKNNQSPFNYLPSSHTIVWWECKHHGEYQRSINVSKFCNFRCPECSRERYESFLQEKVCAYIVENYNYKLNHERNCTIIPRNPRHKGNNSTMPFDNEIEELKLIIEVHGEQHYLAKSYTGIWADKTMSPEEQLHKRKIYDRYKKNVAISNGYAYLVIPYWTEKNESYKKLIDEKIRSLLR